MGARASGLLCWCRAGQPLSQGGDSRALIFTNKGQPVALIFGGSRNGLEDLTEAVPIDVIMEDIIESLDLQYLHIIV